MDSPLPSHSLQPAQLQQMAYVLAIRGRIGPKATVYEGIRFRLASGAFIGCLLLGQSIYAGWACLLCACISALFLIYSYRLLINEGQNHYIKLYKAADVSASSDGIVISFPLIHAKMSAPLNSLVYTQVDDSLLILRPKELGPWSLCYFVAANETIALDRVIPFLKEHGCMEDEEETHPLLAVAPTAKVFIDKLKLYRKRLLILLIVLAVIGLGQIQNGDKLYHIGTIFHVIPENPIKLILD